MTTSSGSSSGRASPGWCVAAPLLLLVVAACGATPAMAQTQQQQTQQQQWKAPAFYKGLEGPRFTVLKTLGDGVELRRYEPGTWASIKATGMDKEAAMRGSFMKLFNYISGANARSAKIEMTAPVMTKVEPGQGPNCESTFTMSFFNPAKLQAAPPQPTDSSVFISKTPALEVWVLPYGGWSSAGMEREKAGELMKKLDAAKEAYSTAPYYTAGYDSPYQLANRRNEVWLPRTAGGAAAGATATTEAGSAKPSSSDKQAAAGR